jgi:hypothetical protein
MLLTTFKLAMVLLLVAGLIIGASGMIFQMQAAEQKTEKTDTEKHPAASIVTKDAIALLAGEGKGGDAAQDSGAEKLYRAMEKRVRAAKSLQVALDGEVDSQAIKGTVKATIYATQGNKSRMEIDFDIDGKADKLLFLTDGKARYTKQGDKGTLDPNPKRAEQEGKLVPGTIARIGITGAIMMGRATAGEEKEVDLDKDAPVTNFKLGAKEMVGDKTAQVVTYKLDFDGTSAKMSVWIDTKTQLPLKRVVAVDLDSQMLRITETYSTFAIDPKLDPKLFEIPEQ